MDVEVVRSRRRRKTVQARMVEGVLEVAIPAAMTDAEERYWVERMKARFVADRPVPMIDLTKRAALLSRRHDLPDPSSISWSKRQRTLWGSCSTQTRQIRISTRVASYPAWVLDYVIVHELAHLAVASHGKRFWALVDRYPLSERARGYLIAKGHEGD